jgi:sulfite reductase (NADPH) flavoprotein alpha-component
MTTKSIKILFATETGNSEELAKETASKAEAKGFEVEVQSVEDYSVDDLAKESCLIFVGSTQGEGEPPEPAWDFHDGLKEADGLDLSNLKFAVLALGDTSYGDLYCAFGKFVEDQLVRLGAEIFMPMKKLDIEFDEDFEDWTEELFSTLTAG